MEASVTVGVVANPASARDIRRIVAKGGAVTTHDKLNRLQCVLAGLGAMGVERVISMSDRSGIAAGLQRLSTRASSESWPMIDFVDQTITGTKTDTTVATETMVKAGVGAIVVLGGDGTNRVVAGSSQDVPLVCLSTGTNNAFPRFTDPTVAGMAAGLVASNLDCRTAGTYRAKMLTVEHAGRVENAVVDVAVTSGDRVGSGAVWEMDSVLELFLCFAEPGAIGLSAVGAAVQPTTRRLPTGLNIRLGGTGDESDPSKPGSGERSPEQSSHEERVKAPIGPGLVADVTIKSVERLEPDAPVEVRSPAGVIAVDGERFFRFDSGDRPVVTLSGAGPVVTDVPAVIHFAATNGLFNSPSTAAHVDDPAHDAEPKSETKPETRKR